MSATSPQTLDLDGKTAIVTGAGSRASGIGNGRAAAVVLARAGAHVALVDSVAENLAETRDMIEAEGGTCLSLTADVTDPDACASMVDTVLATWGGVDVLVNNVGIAGPAGNVVDLDLAAWEQCWRVNVTSMLLMSRSVIPHMRAIGAGSIINMSSAAGLLGGFPQLAYSTTKAAIIGLTRTMAAHHGPEGIRVNALAPGFVYTPMVYAQGLSDEDRQRRMLAAPLQQEGTGWDVAEAVLFLAGPHSRWITGIVLPVDAGLTASVSMANTMTVTSQPQEATT